MSQLHDDLQLLTNPLFAPPLAEGDRPYTRRSVVVMLHCQRDAGASLSSALPLPSSLSDLLTHPDLPPDTRPLLLLKQGTSGEWHILCDSEDWAVVAKGAPTLVLHLYWGEQGAVIRNGQPTVPAVPLYGSICGGLGYGE